MTTWELLGASRGHGETPDKGSEGKGKSTPEADRAPLVMGLGESRASFRDRIIRCALSNEHCLTYTPENPWCHACMISKMCQPRGHLVADGEPEAKVFEDIVIADHLIAKGESS